MDKKANLDNNPIQIVLPVEEDVQPHLPILDQMACEITDKIKNELSGEIVTAVRSSIDALIDATNKQINNNFTISMKTISDVHSKLKNYLSHTVEDV